MDHLSPIADNQHTKTKGTEREPEWRIFSLPALACERSETFKQIIDIKIWCLK